MNTDAQMELMEQHLLFHKAMAEDEESFQRINGYLKVLHEDNTGEKLSDSVDESIRSVFSLVLEKGMDPWAINLEEFARLYSEKVSSDRFDMLVAGRLLLMAWKILNLQSQETRMTAEPAMEEEVIEEDFDFADEDTMIVPDVPISRTYTRCELRSVTMMDLLDAFEEAQREAEIFEARQAAREKIKAKVPTKFDNKAHKEDDETVVETIYQRIYALGMDPMPITEFYGASKEDNITVFVSVLHLVRDGRLEVFQETFPYGEIMVQIKLPEATVPLETLAAVN